MNLIKHYLPPKIYSQLRDIKFFYEGYHNETYRAFMDKDEVQIRVSKNTLASHKSECSFVLRNKDYIFCNDHIMIKKWFKGQEFSSSKENDYLLLKSLKEFWKQDTKPLQKMNWNHYPIKDIVFQRLVEKYHDDNVDTVHCDLAFKNIIITEKKEIKLIDLEWVRKGSKYFDTASLVNKLSLSKNEIVDFLDLEEEKLIDYLYLFKCFRDAAYETVYNPIIKKYQDENLEKIIALKKEFPFQELSALSDIKFVHEGPHNFTFKAFYKTSHVAIKWSKNTYSTLDEEKKILRATKDLFYEQKNLLIKRWYEGQRYISSSEADWHLLDELEKLWKLKIKAPKFDWLIYPIEDTKYKKLVLKNQELRIVLLHGDVAPYNVITSKDKPPKLIDFDFARYGSIYFDVVYFLKFSSLKEQDVLSKLNLTKKTLEEFRYLVKVFDEYALKTRYLTNKF